MKSCDWFKELVAGAQNMDISNLVTTGVQTKAARVTGPPAVEFVKE